MRSNKALIVYYNIPIIILCVCFVRVCLCILFRVSSCCCRIFKKHPHQDHHPQTGPLRHKHKHAHVPIIQRTLLCMFIILHIAYFLSFTRNHWVKYNVSIMSHPPFFSKMSLNVHPCRSLLQLYHCELWDLPGKAMLLTVICQTASTSIASVSRIANPMGLTWSGNTILLSLLSIDRQQYE